MPLSISQFNILVKRERIPLRPVVKFDRSDTDGSKTSNSNKLDILKSVIINNRGKMRTH